MNNQELLDFALLVFQVHAVALAVVNLTPTPKDDKAMGELQAIVVKIYRAIELVAGIWTRRAKQ